MCEEDVYEPLEDFAVDDEATRSPMELVEDDEDESSSSLSSSEEDEEEVDEEEMERRAVEAVTDDVLRGLRSLYFKRLIEFDVHDD